MGMLYMLDKIGSVYLLISITKHANFFLLAFVT